MVDGVLAASSTGLEEVRRLVEAARLDPDADPAHLHLPAALLARACYLTESTIAMCDTAAAGASGIVLRSAVEAWIDCCYTLYGKEGAVLELLQGKLNNERDLASRLAPGLQIERLDQEQVTIDDAVQRFVSDGIVPPDFVPRGKLNVHDRLLQAIQNAGAHEAFIQVYQHVYRALSTMETHPAGAVDVHASVVDDIFRFHVTPEPGVDVKPLIGQVALLVLMAAHELAQQANTDALGLEEAMGELLGALQGFLAPAREMVLAHEDPEVRAMLLRLLDSSSEGSYAPTGQGLSER